MTMKRTIRITESDIRNIVRNVLRESDEYQHTDYDQTVAMFYHGIQDAIGALDMLSEDDDNFKLREIRDKLKSIADEVEGLI